MRCQQRTALYSQAHEASCGVFARSGNNRFRKKMLMQI
jgi:hypothetical protein